MIDCFYKKEQFPCPWCKLVLIFENMINEDKWENSTNQNVHFFSMNDQIILGYKPLMKKLEKSKSIKHSILFFLSNFPVILKEYN